LGALNPRTSLLAGVLRYMILRYSVSCVVHGFISGVGGVVSHEVADPGALVRREVTEVFVELHEVDTEQC